MAALLHALLGLSVFALGSAALRVSTLLAPRGLERAVSAAVLGAAAAVIWAMALGLLALGTSPLALFLAAAATWLAARRLAPAPALGAIRELLDWWSGRSASERALVGAVAGSATAWALWQLRYPALGLDMVHYHLPEIALWVQQGTPGSVEDILESLPVGNYPVTTEVLLAWAQGISRGLVPLTLLPWAMLVLVLAAGWLGLRALGAAASPSGLAVGALALAPGAIAWQSQGAITDPAVLGWLVACAGLCAASRERPQLLAPALLAAALAVGTKTTAAPLALVALGAALYANRAHLGRLRGPLLAALAAGFAVGGLWYLRNLVDHGSPVWPFASGPWGDPVPEAIDFVDTSFVERPLDTIDRVGDLYLERFAGGIALIAGGILAPLLRPSRPVLAAAAATLFGFAVWTTAPLTGVSDLAGTSGGVEPTTFSTTRYLLPVLAAGALSLALAGSARGVRGAAARMLLALALSLNLVQTLDLGFPVAPSAATPLLGALAGVLAALAAGALGAHRLRGPTGTGALAACALAAAVAGALLAAGASGYVERHARTSSLGTAQVTKWLADEQGFSGGGDPVSSTPALIGPLAGDDLAHELDGFSRGEPCARVAERAREGWVVVFGGLFGGVPSAEVGACLPGAEPVYEDGSVIVYRTHGG